MKKTKKIKKNFYSKINDISFLKKRLLTKDIAKILNVSTSSLYMYAKGKRKIPVHILKSAKNLRFSTPKKITSSFKIKRKRKSNYTQKIDKNNFIKSGHKITNIAVKDYFIFEGNQKDIEKAMFNIDSLFDDNDNTVFRIIRHSFDSKNNEYIDSTMSYHIDAIKKLLKNYLLLQEKTSGSESLKPDNFNFIEIERVTYI